jgi:hypothetical protein
MRKKYQEAGTGNRKLVLRCGRMMFAFFQCPFRVVKCPS